MARCLVQTTSMYHDNPSVSQKIGGIRNVMPKIMCSAFSKGDECFVALDAYW